MDRWVLTAVEYPVSRNGRVFGEYRLDPSATAAANVVPTATAADRRETPMTKMANPTRTASIVDKYVAVWSEPDPELRRKAICELWVPDGVEFVEGVQFRGHDGLVARVAEAYTQFVQSGAYNVTSALDVSVHDDVVMFTIQLVSRTGDTTGEIAWAARVFLVLDKDGRILNDYHLTVQPIATE